MPMARPAHEVERSVRSVLAQDLADFELLIGDETGAVEGLVAALGDPRVSYTRNPTRLGFAANHMALLDRARGRYLAVLHDDDWWDPSYLSRLVSVLDRHHDIGLACCAAVLDRGGPERERWPTPLRPGRNDDLLDTMLTEEWFMLVGNTVWRRDVWAGPARRWPDLCCGDLQFFLSAAEAGSSIYFLDAELMAWSIHRGQSGAWRGSDSGLAVADDVLTFWAGWLRGRPEAQVALTARQRARWHLRRARALILLGRSAEARGDVTRAEALGGPDLDGLGKLRRAAALPGPVVRGAVALKRAVTERGGAGPAPSVRSPSRRGGGA
jgi:hypothetical protein